MPQGGTVEKLCPGLDFAEQAPALAAGKNECGPWGSGPVPPSQGPWALGIIEVRPVPSGVPTRPGRPRPFRVGVMEGGPKPLVRSDRGGLGINWGHEAGPLSRQSWKNEPRYGFDPFTDFFLPSVKPFRWFSA